MLSYSIQIFCCQSLGFELFWFLDSKYLSYLPNCFAARQEIILRLDWEKFGTGFTTSFAVRTKAVFFGELRLLSSLRLEVLGWLQIETVFDHVTISNNMILCGMLLYK